MIPLRDDVPSESVPYVTVGLIGLNVLVFLYQASLGHGRYLALYLAAGVAAAAAAAAAQVAVHPRSSVPMIGASGALSGVLGAYLLLFPFARVHMLLIFGFFVRVVRWPALVVLGFWIVIQALSGILTFSASAWGGGEAGGTAWFAHVGGFVAGMGLLFLMRPRRVARL
ncbi:MAG: rhomboid family intramembrane serine protease [Candidatus Rokuibacteriota bacterium]